MGGLAACLPAWPSTRTHTSRLLVWLARLPGSGAREKRGQDATTSTGPRARPDEAPASSARPCPHALALASSGRWCLCSTAPTPCIVCHGRTVCDMAGQRSAVQSMQIQMQMHGPQAGSVRPWPTMIKPLLTCPAIRKAAAADAAAAPVVLARSLARSSTVALLSTGTLTIDPRKWRVGAQCLLSAHTAPRQALDVCGAGLGGHCPPWTVRCGRRSVVVLYYCTTVPYYCTLVYTQHSTAHCMYGAAEGTTLLSLLATGDARARTHARPTTHFCSCVLTHYTTLAPRGALFWQRRAAGLCAHNAPHPPASIAIQGEPVVCTCVCVCNHVPCVTDHIFLPYPSYLSNDTLRGGCGILIVTYGRATLRQRPVGQAPTALHILPAAGGSGVAV